MPDRDQRSHFSTGRGEKWEWLRTVNEGEGPKEVDMLLISSADGAAMVKSESKGVRDRKVG